MDLDLLAESESDSETENEGNDTRNSNVGGIAADGGENRSGDNVGNAAGNDTYFSDDESGESSHGDEDESEAGETDEQDGEELTFEGLSGGVLQWMTEFRLNLKGRKFRNIFGHLNLTKPIRTLSMY